MEFVQTFERYAGLSAFWSRWEDPRAEKLVHIRIINIAKARRVAAAEDDPKIVDTCAMNDVH